MNDLIFNTTLSDGSKFLIVEKTSYFELKRMRKNYELIQVVMMYKTETKRADALTSARDIIRNIELGLNHVAKNTF